MHFTRGKWVVDVSMRGAGGGFGWPWEPPFQRFSHPRAGTRRIAGAVPYALKLPRWPSEAYIGIVRLVKAAVVHRSTVTVSRGPKSSWTSITNCTTVRRSVCHNPGLGLRIAKRKEVGK